MFLDLESTKKLKQNLDYYYILSNNPNLQFNAQVNDTPAAEHYHTLPQGQDASSQ